MRACTFIKEKGGWGILKEVENRAQDNPFNTILVSLPESLPHCLLFSCFPGDADPSSTSCPIGRRGILLNLSEFNPLRWDVVSRIGEIEHTPKRSIRVWLGNLEQGEICGVRRRKGELVDRRKDTGVSNRPLEVSGCFTVNGFRASS